MTEHLVKASTRVLGVIGHPISHSLSPQMQNAEIQRLGLDYIYVAWDIAPDAIEAALRGMKAMGIVGINATIPHKQAVIPFVDEMTEEADLAGAVNTLHFTSAGVIGYNTDVGGWRQDIERDLQLSDKRITIIGAGGAARGIAVAACLAGVQQLVIANRSAGSADALLEVVRNNFGEIDSASVLFDDPRCQKLIADSDIILNVTPVGMASSPGIPIPPHWLHPRHYIYDTIYNPAETELLRAARAIGCRTRNGLGMLARQGALSLAIWTAATPNPSAMEATLKRCLDS